MSICDFLLKLFNCQKQEKVVFRLKITDGINKTDSVRRHLQEFTTINNKQAYELYEVTRLASIISLSDMLIFFKCSVIHMSCTIFDLVVSTFDTVFYSCTL